MPNAWGHRNKILMAHFTDTLQHKQAQISNHVLQDVALKPLSYALGKMISLLKWSATLFTLYLNLTLVAVLCPNLELTQ